ncbi:MAG TPA: TIM barrel protein [Acetivibrio clariflavus]|nr:TIM barrel protein [Acetivibrio clariflavus]HPU40794.1 TIM barrel protein [Acetivibrio clariflavus]
MKLAISNIAWDADKDLEVYKLMEKYGFCGLEIAPTRLIGDRPYDRIDEAEKLANDLKNLYNFEICSMQSILYGRTENIFESPQNRESITSYLFKAIDFAAAVSCRNMVFGCPKNRWMTKEEDYEIAVDFFKVLSEYALKKGTVISIEANPSMYGTNFINYTREAVKLVKDVNCEGFKINLDFGTIIANEESTDEIAGYVDYINHVHISEPGLLPICRRQEHRELAFLLREKSYKGFVSIEMKKDQDDSLDTVERTMNYMVDVFGE